MNGRRLQFVGGGCRSAITGTSLIKYMSTLRTLVGIRENDCLASGACANDRRHICPRLCRPHPSRKVTWFSNGVIGQNPAGRTSLARQTDPQRSTHFPSMQHTEFLGEERSNLRHNPTLSQVFPCHNRKAGQFDQRIRRVIQGGHASLEHLQRCSNHRESQNTWEKPSLPFVYSILRLFGRTVRP